MTTGVVIAVSGTSVTAICCGPPPGIAKEIVTMRPGGSVRRVDRLA